jgi:hypothetical protein
MPVVSADLAEQFEALIAARGLADALAVVRVEYRMGCILTTLTIGAVIGAAGGTVVGFAKLYPSSARASSSCCATSTASTPTSATPTSASAAGSITTTCSRRPRSGTPPVGSQTRSRAAGKPAGRAETRH